MIVDQDVVESSRFTRNRFLAVAGTTLTAIAANLFFPQEAQACYIPNGCHGYCQCSCCSGSTCCRSDCKSGYYGCESGGQCWYTCAYDGCCLYRFRCCDWAYAGSGRCICRANVGAC